MRLPRLLLAAMAAVLVILASASIAFADTPAARSTALTFGGSSPTAAKGQVTLSATLTTDGNKPLSNQPIDFYESVQLLGARDSYLGTAQTDSTGTATLGYEPASTGTRTIRATFAGAEGFASSEATGPVAISETRPLFVEEPRPFGVVGEVLPYALGAVVLAVWGLLAFVLLRTASGIAGATSLGGRRPALVGLAALAAALRRHPINIGEEWK